MAKRPGYKRNKKAYALNYRELADRYKLLSDLMDHVPDVIYFKDKKGKLIMVNRAHAKGLGLEPEQVVGKSDFDFFPKKRAEIMAKDDLYVMKTGKPIIDKIERATRPDGIDNYVSTTKIPRYDEKGNIIGLIGITRDITYRKHFEHLRQEKIDMQKRLQAMEELNNIKSEFISVVSHELNTPLAIIKEAVMLITDELAGPVNDKQKELLIKAKNNIQYLKNIIDQLLDVSRIERGKFELHYSLVNLNDLLKDSSDYFKKLAEEKHIVLDYGLPKTQVNIFIDAERINQVISNLVTNAIKFTEQNGHVRIDVEIFETKVRVGVIDMGIGIAKQDFPKLFNKFEQFSRTPEAKRKGIGLGLAISKELVERHGGEIWAESRLGVGSKFYFTLPRFYTDSTVDKAVRDEINGLLYKDSEVYLINVLLVNFKELKKKVKVEPRDLFEALTQLINETFKGFLKEKGKELKIILQDCRKGEWSICFQQATEKGVSEIYGLLKDAIKSYFIKNKIEDVFVNLGVLPYRRDRENLAVEKVPCNIFIERVCVGLEKRHFKRISCNIVIGIIFSDDKTIYSQTVDISKGGLCFISEKRFETDKQIVITLKSPNRRRHFDIKSRVAWIKNISEGSKEAVHMYQTGVEFTGLKERDRKELSELIQSISA